LGILSQDQEDLKEETRRIAVFKLVELSLSTVMKTFYVLKKQRIQGIMLQRFFFTRLRAHKFFQKLTRPFIQRTFEMFPDASLSLA
jgi:hypothetical protein